MSSFNSAQIAEMEKYYRIALINSISGYKSLNLLGTINSDGITNLCLISSVFHLGSNPPLLGMVMRPERPHNDSLRNIRSVGQYTLNNVLPEFYKQAHQTSASYPSGVSEFDECGLTKRYNERFKAPFVGESSINIGLELLELIDMEINGTSLVIGEIKQILIDGGLASVDGSVDHIKARTLVVSGLDSYYQPQPIGQMAYAKPGQNPQNIGLDAIERI